MNNKGFAVSGIFYTLLLLLVVTMCMLLYNLQGRKTLLDRLKTDVVDAVERNSDVDYLIDKINKLEKKTSSPIFLGTIEATEFMKTISVDTTPYRKILVELVQKQSGIVFLSKEFYIDHLNLEIEPSEYNAMDSLYHSSTWSMYFVYSIRKDSLGVKYSSNSWADSTTTVNFYGIK